MNTQALVSKLYMVGRKPIGYNSFGIVEEVGAECLVHLESRGKLVTVGKDLGYSSAMIFEHFIIVMNRRAKHCIFVKGSKSDILKQLKYTVIWGVPNGEMLIPGQDWDRRINKDGILGIEEVIGVTDGRGYRKLVNYAAKTLVIDNRSLEGVSRITRDGTKYTVTRYMETLDKRNVTPVRDIIVDKDLNILWKNQYWMV